MSNALRFNLILVGVVFLIAFSTVMSIAPDFNSKEVVASPYCVSPRTIPAIDARAAYAIDISSGTVLFAKNESAQLPLASLTKTVTALTASQYLDPSSTIVIPRDALSVEGESGLIAEEEWHVQDLIDFTLIESSNDGARALALETARVMQNDLTWFYERMNELSTQSGASQTYFVNDSGLDFSSTTAGAYGSARDVAAILRYAVREHPGVLDGSSAWSRTFTTVDGRVHEATNTSSIPALTNGARISKTGYTDLAGGNLGVVFDALPGKPVVAVVLGSTREGRDGALLALIEAVRERARIDAICAEYSDSSW